MSALVIQLDARESECIACGAYVCPPRFGLPMYEGEFVENGDTTTEWGGFDACRECFEAHRDCGVAGLRIRLAALNAREQRNEAPL